MSVRVEWVGSKPLLPTRDISLSIDRASSGGLKIEEVCSYPPKLLKPTPINTTGETSFARETYYNGTGAKIGSDPTRRQDLLNRASEAVSVREIIQHNLHSLSVSQKLPDSAEIPRKFLQISKLFRIITQIEISSKPNLYAIFLADLNI